MSRLLRNPLFLAFLLVLLLSSHFQVRAQTSTFDLPSTEVTAPRQVRFELGLTFHPGNLENGGFQEYSLITTYGVTKRVEAGVNFYYTRTSESTEPLLIEPNVKWKFYENETNGISAATGVVLSLPLNHRSANSKSAFVYGLASKRFSGANNPTLTAGFYNLVGILEGTKRGVILGYEQPLSERFTLLADWASGNSDFGNLSAGVGIGLTRRSNLYIGGRVGNQGRGNNSIGVYYDITF